MKRVNSIQKKLEKTVVSKEYLKDLKTFANSFVTAAHAINGHYQSMANEFRSSPYYLAIRDTAIQNSLQSLTSTGINQNVNKPLRTMLMTAVTSGQSYAALTESMRDEILSSEENIGSLSRYVGTYTVTALSRFTGQYMTAVNKDFGWEWYRYVGSNIKTTREFCIHMTKKEWIHESEFETVLSGEIDGEQVQINPANDLPRGMFDDTDPTNFTVNVGGWNCRHQLYPVHDASVPDDVKKKLEEKQIKKDKKETVQKIKEHKSEIEPFKGKVVESQNFVSGKMTILRRSLDDIYEHAIEDENIRNFLKTFDINKLKTIEHKGWGENRSYPEDHKKFDKNNPNKKKHEEADYFNYYTINISDTEYWANVKYHKHYGEVLYTIEKNKPEHMIKGIKNEPLKTSTPPSRGLARLTSKTHRKDTINFHTIYKNRKKSEKISIALPAK